MSLPKVSVVGAGQVGATAAHLLALKGLADLTLIDLTMDISQHAGLGVHVPEGNVLDSSKRVHSFLQLEQSEWHRLQAHGPRPITVWW